LSTEEQSTTTIKTQTVPEQRPRPGYAEDTIVGPFHLECMLAMGGFGSVYRAHRLGEDTPIAVKVLHASLVDDRDATMRFMREADASWSITHPNVVRIHDVGMLPDDRPYLSMELLEGQSLHDHLQHEKRLSVDDALAILAPLCDALAEIHRLGIVHRDLKPSNVFLDRRDGGCRVVLLDFGIAKFLGIHSIELTEAHHLVGTPGRMAPEQILNRPVDARTDVYALGALAFQMLAGERPFGDRPQEIQKQLHLHAKRPRVSEQCNVAPALDAVLVRAMAIDPAHRYASPGEFLDAFRTHARNVAAAASSAPKHDRERDTIALLLLLHVPAQALDHPDDALLEDIDGVMDIAINELRVLGFVPFLEAGTKLLYVRPVEPVHSIALAQSCDRALADARAVYHAVARRPRPDGRVSATLRLHVDLEQKRDIDTPGIAIFEEGALAAGTTAAGVSMTMDFASAIGTPGE
jgi:eukaryotic-like serine/threonine-protein kinase